MSAWVTQGVRVYAPDTGTLAPPAICTRVAPTATWSAADTGGWLLPGLVDLAARLREPGQSHKASIASETQAALRNGITALAAIADPVAPLESSAQVESVLERAGRAGPAAARVWPIASLVRGSAEESLTDMAALQAAGVVAVGLLGRPLANAQLLRRALQYAAMLNLKVVLQPLEAGLSAGACAHDGAVAQRLGLPGVPAVAETIALARDLALIEDTGVTAHIARISSARSVELIAAAKARGLPITCDVAMHQLYLSDLDLVGFDPNLHLLPPLRTPQDRDALRAGVASGVIDFIVSDHAPHDRDAKLAPFPGTEPGLSALDSFLGLGLKLVLEGDLSLARWIEACSLGPARWLGLADSGAIWLDADADRRLTADALHSQGRNTPFLGWCLPGVVRAVWAPSAA